jgi:hypothetical protein
MIYKTFWTKYLKLCFITAAGDNEDHFKQKSKEDNGAWSPMKSI